MIIPDFTNSSELLADSYQRKLYQDILLQLNKDFQRTNIDFKLTNLVLPEELLSLLKEKIYFLLLERFDSYLNLLYAIDVPEKNFKQIKSKDVIVISQEVSFLILKRVYQKVIIRSQYS